MATLIRLVPWIAALVPVLVLWPTVVGLIAALVWIAVIAAFRVGARGQDRTSRAGLDLVLLTCCVGAFFFGGLYFAPAAAAFWLLDREAPDLASGQATIRAPTHPPSRYLGLISGVLGMGGVGAFLLLPTHTTASSTLTPPNVSTVTGRNALQIGLDAQAIVAITLIGVFFALVAIGSVITAPRRRLRRTLLGCGVLGLFLVTLLDGFTIGILIAPGLLLAFVTFTVSVVERERAMPV